MCRCMWLNGWLSDRNHGGCVLLMLLLLLLLLLLGKRRHGCRGSTGCGGRRTRKRKVLQLGLGDHDALVFLTKAINFRKEMHLLSLQSIDNKCGLLQNGKRVRFPVAQCWNLHLEVVITLANLDTT